MNLYLLRHGLAVERGTPGYEDDATRQLTPKGRRQVREVAAAMQAMELRFETILSSPLVRAHQTAEITAAGLKLKKYLAFADELSPGGPANKLVEKISELKSAPENILLVGHEPDLGELISLLVTGKKGAGLALKKAGLAKLEIENLRAGQCAMLAWLLTPKQMKLM